jgi:hypothetical protein
MTDRIDPPTAEPAAPTEASEAPAVASTAPSAGESEATGARRTLEVVVWVVALAALVVLCLVRAGIAGTTGSERIGYVIGGVAIALLISAAARWLWLRARRRNDAAARFVSPWIPVGAVIVALLSLFGGNRS